MTRHALCFLAQSFLGGHRERNLIFNCYRFPLKANSRKRFKHDETTAEIKAVVDGFNMQFGGYYKVMVYWSRLAVGFLIYKENKMKQASKSTLKINPSWL